MAGTTRAKVRKDRRIQDDRRLIDGILAHFAASDAIVLRGKRYTRDDLVRLLQQRIDVTPPIERARAAWRALVAKERAVLAETNPVVTLLRRYIQLVHGDAHEVLAKFGMKPDKRRKLGIDEVAAAVEKRLATRKARGTMGHAQKKKIRGG
jgi:hypothetical protein